MLRIELINNFQGMATFALTRNFFKGLNLEKKDFNLIYFKPVIFFTLSIQIFLVKIQILIIFSEKIYQQLNIYSIFNKAKTMKHNSHYTLLGITLILSEFSFYSLNLSN